MTELSISFFPLESWVDYNYVVIVAKYNDSLTWVRKKNSLTWEIPGGHIEQFEDPESAARRELWEETGAKKFYLKPICDFTVLQSNNSSYNRLFYANIIEFDDLPGFEIDEIMVSNNTPSSLTYGTIQLELIKYVARFLGEGIIC